MFKMKFNRLFYISILSFMIIFFSACSPSKEDTGTASLKEGSRQWIPFGGNESVTFISDTAEITFTGQGKDSLFENVRYATDQSGFFTVQKDYYADVESQTLYFKSSSTPYTFRYYLQKYMGETGEWDIIRVALLDGDYYKNEIKIVVYETDSYDKGEIFSFSSSMNLNGQVFTDVYFWKQENRPYELYYTQAEGIVGFKLASNELWSLKPAE